MPDKIAVIGDRDSVLAFKAVGVEVFNATTAVEAATLVKKLSAERYSVVFIAESLAEQIPDTLSRAKLQTYPAVVPIPTGVKPTGFGKEGIRSDVEKAIGVDVIFNKEDKQ